MDNFKMTSLGELARDKKLNISKSMLLYYSKFGLIKHIDVVGKMQIYNDEETRKRLKLISQYKEQGLSLQKIKDIFEVVDKTIEESDANEKNNSGTL